MINSQTIRVKGKQATLTSPLSLSLIPLIRIDLSVFFPRIYLHPNISIDVHFSPTISSYIRHVITR